ncbi:MAG: TIGR02172 family protein [Bacteroidales bacterium]|nr:TIGR02172 family protein [Bacteroidales bacterium]
MENYEHINLDEYVQSGEGGTALSYSHKDGKTLAKLFMKGMGAETAEREFMVNKIVYEMGIPTPKPLRLVTDGTRFGAEYELIPNKRSFARILSQEPEQLESLSLRFAAMAQEIHRTPVDTTRLPSMKNLIREQIVRYKEIPEDVREKALQFLEAVPDSPTCLHGDLHIGNVITDGERTLWIDVGDFAYGVPEWDLGMMYYASNYMSEPRALSIFHLPIEVLKQHWAVFAKAYYGTTNQEELRKKEQALFPFFAVKMLLVISKIHNGQGAPSDMILSLIRRCLGI